MFGLKQRAEERARRIAEAAEEARRLSAAEQMGRDIAGHVTAAVDQFIALRARPAAERLYSVFVGLVSEPETNSDVSAIDFIRCHAKIFTEKLDEFKAAMIKECETSTRDWLNLAESIGTLDHVEAYIISQIENLYFEMIARAAEFGGGLIQALQAAGVNAISTAHYDAGVPTPSPKLR